MAEWQPIETAPIERGQDGQLGVCVAERWGTRWAFHHAWWDDQMEAWTDISSDKILEPTHWMPLPEPPHNPAHRGAMQDE